jgi:serine/threonine protein kinase
MARDVVDGLRFLHTDCKVVHLDVAARNILVDVSKKLVLGDFGTSARVGSKTSTPRTVDERITAPEVLKPGGRHPILTGKEDIFSMGKLVEEMHRLAGLTLSASTAQQVQKTPTSSPLSLFVSFVPLHMQRYWF